MRAVQLLKTVGLTEYEAKAYIALIALGEPMNGYEVAKASGIPRSTIYEVLAKLVARGAAVQVPGGGRSTESFRALPVDSFIEGYRSKLASTLDGLAETLPRVAAKNRTHLVQKLAGREAIAQRMNDVVARAQHYVWLSIWPDLVPALRRSATVRANDGVDIASIIFGEVASFPGLVVSHEYLSPEVTEERLGCRLYIVAADHQEVVIATAEGENWQGIWSDDLAVSLLAAEHVRFDMTIQILCRNLDMSGDHEALRTDPTLKFLSRSMETSTSQIMAKMTED
ncbi:MAG: TrmB family transcriptional regulator [Actinomycetota bacterium]